MQWQYVHIAHLSMFVSFCVLWLTTLIQWCMSGTGGVQRVLICCISVMLHISRLFVWIAVLCFCLTKSRFWCLLMDWKSVNNSFFWIITVQSNNINAICCWVMFYQQCCVLILIWLVSCAVRHTAHVTYMWLCQGQTQNHSVCLTFHIWFCLNNVKVTQVCIGPDYRDRWA